MHCTVLRWAYVQTALTLRVAHAPPPSGYRCASNTCGQVSETIITHNNVDINLRSHLGYKIVYLESMNADLIFVVDYNCKYHYIF